MFSRPLLYLALLTLGMLLTSLLVAPGRHGSAEPRRSASFVSDRVPAPEAMLPTPQNPPQARTGDAGSGSESKRAAPPPRSTAARVGASTRDFVEREFPDEEFVPFEGEGCTVWMNRSGGATARRHLSIITLHGLEEAARRFEELVDALPHALKRTERSFVAVSFRDSQQFQRWVEASGWGEVARARFLVTRRPVCIYTYPEDIFASRFRNQRIEATLQVAIDAGFAAQVFLHEHDGAQLRPGVLFEDSLRTYLSTGTTTFDPRAEQCDFTHTGWDEELMLDIASAPRRTGRFSISELVGTHRERDFEGIHPDRRAGAVRASYSLTYYLIHGDGGLHCERFGRWVAWQLSAAAARASRGEAQAEFRRVFGDVAKLEAAWRTWEASLDPLKSGFWPPP